VIHDCTFALTYGGEAAHAYVFVKSDGAMGRWSKARIRVYREAIGFPTRINRGECDNYPVIVFDDFTVPSGELVPVEIEDIPSTVMDRYRQWERRQQLCK